MLIWMHSTCNLHLQHDLAWQAGIAPSWCGVWHRCV